jgi:hypothetical protein
LEEDGDGGRDDEEEEEVAADANAEVVLGSEVIAANLSEGARRRPRRE